MIILKTPQEIKTLQEGGRRHAEILRLVREFIQPGMSTLEIDTYAEKLVREQGDIPAFKGYRPEGVSRAYQHTLCISINEVVVHGIPSENIIVKDGDIVSIDLGLCHKGLFTDSAITFIVGTARSLAHKDLVNTTQHALSIAIEQAYPGNRVGDIGYAVESFIKKRYGIVKGLAGHGVGKKIHEDPYVPNYGKKGTGVVLQEGMVIAIEPMLNLGTANVHFLDDEYTVITADGKPSAHFEHTVAITKDGPIILTQE